MYSIQAGIRLYILPDKLCNDLSVGVRFKAVTSVGQEDLDIFVVGDDAIVDNQELIEGITSVRMTVNVRGSSVGGPSCVSNAWKRHK